MQNEQSDSSNQNITQLLSEGKVSFSYKNANGETRNAVGTTNSKFLPESVSNVTVTNTGDLITYFDLNVNDWRSFKQSNLDQSSIQPQS